MSTVPVSHEMTLAKEDPHELARVHRSAVVRYAVAVGLVGSAVALKSLHTQLGQAQPFLLLYAAVILAAWSGGRGPGLLALGLAAAAASVLYLPPYAWSRANAVQLGLFLVEGCFVGAVTAGMKEARERADAAARCCKRSEDQIRRLNQAHRALSTCSEALVRAQGKDVLLEEICRAIVEIAGYRMCWVGRAEHDEQKSVRPIAHAGDERGYLALTDVTWADCARGRGPVGTAIRTGRPFVQQDVVTHPAFAPWRAEAMARGYASVIALPIRSEGGVFGALTIYAAEKDAFDADAVRLLVDLTNDLAYGIAALRTRACAQAERARFESAIMHAPVGVAVLSGPDHVVQLANSLWLCLGLVSDAPVGKPLAKVVPVSAGDVVARLHDVYTTGERCELTEHKVEVKRPDGSAEARFFNVAGAPLRSGEGKVTDIVVTCSDVTREVTARHELEEARAVAERASSAKDDFLRIVSHELRTPLTPILTWAELLWKDHGKDLARLERGLEVILGNVRTEVQLVSDLLDVSEMAAGAITMEMRSVELGPIVAACVDQARTSAAAKGVEVDASIASDTPLVGDAHRLAQATKNLLSNAVKFTPRGGRVHVEVTRGSDTLTLRVRDTGKGIPSGELGWVFDPFRTGDPSTTRAEGGLGLGLSIVRHIVEAHGGNVRAESDGNGKGATLVVELKRDGALAQPGHVALFA